jgi:hypothetical protein
MASVSMSGTDQIYQRLQRLAEEAGLPQVELGTSYNTSALKVGGKSFVSVKNAETIVLSIPIEDKERLLEMAPDIYFQTDHYVGWPSLPLRAHVIDDDELKRRLIDAWRFRAPKKLRAAYDAGARDAG